MAEPRIIRLSADDNVIVAVDLVGLALALRK